MLARMYNHTVGMFEVKLEIANPEDRERRATVSLLVDTGAGYSMILRRALEQIGATPTKREMFEIADGREIARDIGEVTFFCNGEHAVSRVIFGEEGEASVLGAVTLEELALQVDPLHQQLRRAKLRLY